MNAVFNFSNFRELKTASSYDDSRCARVALVVGKSGLHISKALYAPLVSAATRTVDVANSDLAALFQRATGAHWCAQWRRVAAVARLTRNACIVLGSFSKYWGVARQMQKEAARGAGGAEVAAPVLVHTAETFLMRLSLSNMLISIANNLYNPAKLIVIHLRW